MVVAIVVNYWEIASPRYALIIEYAVYSLGDYGLTMIDYLARDNGATIALDIVGITRKINGGYFTPTWRLSLWGQIGQSGQLYGINLN